MGDSPAAADAVVGPPRRCYQCSTYISRRDPHSLCPKCRGHISCPDTCPERPTFSAKQNFDLIKYVQQEMSRTPPPGSDVDTRRRGLRSAFASLSPGSPRESDARASSPTVPADAVVRGEPMETDEGGVGVSLPGTVTSESGASPRLGDALAGKSKPVKSVGDKVMDKGSGKKTKLSPSPLSSLDKQSGKKDKVSRPSPRTSVSVKDKRLVGQDKAAGAGGPSKAPARGKAKASVGGPQKAPTRGQIQASAGGPQKAPVHSKDKGVGGPQKAPAQPSRVGPARERPAHTTQDRREELSPAVGAGVGLVQLSAAQGEQCPPVPLYECDAVAPSGRGTSLHYPDNPPIMGFTGQGPRASRAAGSLSAPGVAWVDVSESVGGTTHGSKLSGTTSRRPAGGDSFGTQVEVEETWVIPLTCEEDESSSQHSSGTEGSHDPGSSGSQWSARFHRVDPRLQREMKAPSGPAPPQSGEPAAMAPAHPAPPQSGEHEAMATEPPAPDVEQTLPQRLVGPDGEVEDGSEQIPNLFETLNRLLPGVVRTSVPATKQPARSFADRILQRAQPQPAPFQSLPMSEDVAANLARVWHGVVDSRLRPVCSFPCDTVTKRILSHFGGSDASLPPGGMPKQPKVGDKVYTLHPTGTLAAVPTLPASLTRPKDIQVPFAAETLLLDDWRVAMRQTSFLDTVTGALAQVATDTGVLCSHSQQLWGGVWETCLPQSAMASQRSCWC